MFDAGGLVGWGEATRLAAVERIAGVAEARRDLDVEELLALLRFCEVNATVSDSSVSTPGGERLIELGDEGCPRVAEFAILELAARLGRTFESVAVQLRQVLNLRHRFPMLWEAVVSGVVPAWQADNVTEECRALTQAQAAKVDGQLRGVSWQSMPRIMRKVRGLIVQADPEAARERAAWLKQGQFAAVQTSNGVSDVYGRIAAADGRFLDATLNRFAGIFETQGDDSPLQARRARGLALLAFPARALQVLQQAVQPDLPGWAPDCSAPHGGPVGHTCGQVTVDPEKLLPRASLHVHIAAESLETGEGVARVEGIGPVLVSQLRDLLSATRLTVSPVIDAAGMTPFDSYEIPARMRAAVIARNPIEVFPGSGRSARSCQLDHTRPYVHGPGGALGQTHPDNLGPLGSRAHRAKTHGNFHLDQPRPGVFEWRTPLGYRFRVPPEHTEYLGDDRAHQQPSAVESRLRVVLSGLKAG